MIMCQSSDYVMSDAIKGGRISQQALSGLALSLPSAWNGDVRQECSGHAVTMRLQSKDEYSPHKYG